MYKNYSGIARASVSDLHESHMPNFEQKRQNLKNCIQLISISFKHSQNHNVI